jgi:hypothetical protein
MRYILDDSGYIYSVSCNYIACDSKDGVEYTGTVPDGYNSLEEWAARANIRAYKIVNGNLTYDANRAAALEAEWAKCKSGKNIIMVRPSATYTISATNTTETVPFNQEREKTGTKLSISGSGIKIGSGVSMVKVSLSSVFIPTSAENLMVYIVLNETIKRYITATSAGASKYSAFSCSDYYLSCTENDLIYIKVYGTKGDKIDNVRTHLSVEVIE